MCGIAGFWLNKSAATPPVEILERMGEALAHRGPDDSGQYWDQSAGLGLSFRRLAIIDLSAKGHQPMLSASGRFALVFNGEVYNFEEIRSDLPAQRWRGYSDTEVVLAAIEHWGLERALQRFVGMFAMALWDLQNRQLFLIRDRLGIKPLYYGRIGGSFVFASELKAIREFPACSPEIDRDALALYLRFSCVPSPHSIYRGFHKLPPGHVLKLTAADGLPSVSAYWSAADAARAGMEAPFSGSEEDAARELEDKISVAVRLRMIAHVPLGAFLSGGIDSSTVVALMQRQSVHPVKTFSVGFRESAFNEAEFASKVAAHLGTEHFGLYVTPQAALDVVPQLSRMYDEPFADSSQIPTYLVSKLARQYVTVSLSGDGGDELFGGYSRYLFLPSVWHKIRRIPPLARRLLAALLEMLPSSAMDRVGLLVPRKARPLGDKLHKAAEFLRGGPGTIYLYALSQWSDPASVVLGSIEPVTVSAAINRFCSLPVVQQMAMLTDLTNYLPDDVLTKLDRASMAVGLEARVPLLDHRVVEFAWRLPLHYKLRDSEAKRPLRSILYRYVPRELVDRPKMGFAVPLAEWLRGPLRPWAEALLSPDALSGGGYLKVAPIRKKWEEHLAGTRAWDYPLWNILMFQQWLASSCEQSPVPRCIGVEAS